MTIKTEVLPPEEIFQKEVVYKVPEYQRGYVWKQEEQWEPLWEDVQSLAEKWLEVILKGTTVSASDAPSHFLGAVVLQQEDNMPGQIKSYSVIDGQQRLTTLQILLDATQEKVGSDGLPQSENLQALVLNKSSKDKDDRFKILPALSDRAAFIHAMDDNLTTNKYKKSPIAEAHEYFGRKTTEWFEVKDVGTKLERSKALYIALAHLLKVVVITVEHKDDPQIIFETLNARGTPLQQSELVKNYMIHLARKEMPDATKNFVRERLKPFNDRWFAKEVRQGSVRHPRLDQFLFYWITMRRAKEIVAGDVFREFKKYIDDSDAKISSVAEDIETTAKLYRDIEEPPDYLPIKVFLDRSRIIDIGITKPLLLWLLTNSGDNTEAIKRAVVAMESFLVRRMIIGRSAAGLNRMVVEILSALSKAGDVDTGAQIIVESLKKQKGFYEWPSDEIFQQEFCSRHLYGWMAQRKIVMIPSALNEEMKSGFAESVDYKTLTIEHLMPRSWKTKDWPIPALEGESKANAAEKRDSLIHTIGNLTLVTKKLNSKLANKSWDNKREALSQHSSLFLNKELCGETFLKVWDESAINNRARYLAEVATKIWPSPNHTQYSR